MKLDLSFAQVLSDMPIYDLHAHWGPFGGAHMPAADPGVARRLIEQAGVRRVVISHHTALSCSETGQSASVEAVRAMPDLLRAYCVINGNDPAQIERDLAAFDALCPAVFVGFKMHGDLHRVSITDARFRPAWEFAQARRLPVLLHTWGGSVFNGVAAVESVAGAYPDVPILLGHSLHGAWDDAIRLTRTYTNLFLELTAVLDERGVVERLVDGVGSERVVFGTDFPWFGYPFYLGGLLGARLGEAALRNILYRNAQRILGEVDPQDD